MSFEPMLYGRVFYYQPNVVSSHSHSGAFCIKNYAKFLFFFLLAFGMGIKGGRAQNNGFSVHNTFRNTGNDGDPIVTGLSAALIGTPGDGWLRLTTNVGGSQRGFAYIDKAFSPPLGMSIQFAYRAWAPSDNFNDVGVGLADGLSVFLYDGATTFNPGSCGGGLMYSRSSSCGTGEALAGGYVGIGLDEYGSYSCRDAIAADDNGPGMNPTCQANYSSSIAIRGEAPNNTYITGTNANLLNAFDPTLNGTTIGTTVAGDPPNPNVYYRQVRFYLLPTSSYPAFGVPDIPDDHVAPDGTVDMLISVFIQTEAGGPFRTVIYNQRMNQRISVGTKTFKIGFGASTGAGFANHDIRDMVAAAPMQLQTTNAVTPGTAVVGGTVAYTSVIKNTGLHDVSTLSNGTASFVIHPTGVDIINPQNIAAGAVIDEGPTNPGNLVTAITYNAASSTIGNYVYTVSNFPVEGTITLTYNGTVSSTAASAINDVSITPPVGYINIDPHSGHSVAQTFIRPVLTQPLDAVVCSDVAINKEFVSNPTNFTTYTWSRTANGLIAGSVTGNGAILNDVLTNSSGTDQVTTYTITPQVISTIVNSDGSTGGNQTTNGTAKAFNLTVKSNLTTAQAAAAITVTSSNNGTTVTLTATSTVPSPTYTWYANAAKTGGAIAVGTFAISGLTEGQSYTYFVTIAGANLCESGVVSGTITVPPSQFVTISSGSVLEGGAIVLTASLSVTNVSDVDVTLIRPPSFPVGYTMPTSVRINAGSLNRNFSIQTVDDVISADRVFNITGSASSYSILSGSLTVVDKNTPASQLIRISSGSVLEGNSIVLTASRTVSGGAVTVNLLASPAFSNVTIPVSVIIPNGALNGNFTISTSDNSIASDQYLNISGSASSYSVLSGSLTVVDKNTPASQLIRISSGSVLEGNSIVLTASRTVSGGAVTVNLLAGPAFSNVTIPVSVIIPNGALSGSFTIQTTNNGIPLNQYLNIIGSASGYSVLSGSLTVVDFNQITMTASNGTVVGTSIVVVEGHSVTITLTSLRQITASDGDVALNIVSGAALTNPTIWKSPITLSIGTNSSSFSQTLSLSNTVGADEILVVNAIDHSGVYTINPVTITLQAYPVVVVSNPITGCYGTIAALTSVISNYDTNKYAYIFYNPSGGIITNLMVSTSGVYQVDAINKTSLLTSKIRASITVTIRPQINLGLTTTLAVICGNSSIDLKDYIASVTPNIDPLNYNFSFQDPFGSVLGSSVVSAPPGVYKISATNPSTGCSSGWMPLMVTSVAVPSFVVNTPVTIYHPFLMDLTDPSVILSASSGIDHYNYFDNSLAPINLTNAQNIAVAGVYYIQAETREGCVSAMQPIQVFFGATPTLQMVRSSPTLMEGSSGTFTLSLVPAGVFLQKDISFTLAPAVGNMAKAAHYTIPIVVTLSAGKNSIPVPVQALADKILYNDELLIVQASNTSLGVVTSSLTITDATAIDPSNLVITIGNGTIFYDETIPIQVSLPVGITSARDIIVTLNTSTRSTLSNLSSPPSFPSSVIIPAGTNFGEFDVSGSSTSDVPAILVIEGLSMRRVNEGVIIILNQKIKAIISVSPNGDDIDEFCNIENIEKFPDNEVDIYDRMGILVWQAKRYNNRDTRFLGEYNQGRSYKLPNGNYFYKIKFFDHGEGNVVKGFLKVDR